MDVVTPFWAILHSKYLTDRAKDDLSYVLKTNFIFEWVLENGQEILNEGDDIEEIYSKIVDNIKKENMSTKNLYFDDAVEEIKQFSKFLEEIPLVKNDVPKNDVAYKTGNETVECSREDISKASEWGKIIAYIAERVKVNKEIFKGKRQYGNLYEILDDAFYLKYKSMGRFASKYIQKLIKEITECSFLRSGKL